MKDKSEAMPWESRGVARAWLIKQVIGTQAIKARRRIAFPQLQSPLKALISSHDKDTRCYELTMLFARPRHRAANEARRKDERLLRWRPIG
jgi:hypothetical protein